MLCWRSRPWEGTIRLLCYHVIRFHSSYQSSSFSCPFGAYQKSLITVLTHVGFLFVRYTGILAHLPVIGCIDRAASVSHACSALLFHQDYYQTDGHGMSSSVSQISIAVLGSLFEAALLLHLASREGTLHLFSVFCAWLSSFSPVELTLVQHASIWRLRMTRMARHHPHLLELTSL
ncbi:hypothetical protein BKA81DRAFT_141331 [Phyllosticta paracitricarpa]